MTIKQFSRAYVLPSTRQEPYREDKPWPIGNDRTDALCRFIRFDQLIDILANKRIWFSVPSQLGHLDFLDGMPDERLAEADGLDILNQYSGNCTVDYGLARKLSRDSTTVSCWTYGGETYAMWKAYSDLQWGICLKMSYATAKTWADDQDLDHGPVQYLRTACPPESDRQRVDLVSPVIEYDVLHSSFPELSPPLKGAPLQWFKASFFHTEFEFRFGKRRNLMNVLSSCHDPRTLDFQPEAVSFDPDKYLDAGAIITGPQAPKWYTDYVNDVVYGHCPRVSVKPSDGIPWSEHQ